MIIRLIVKASILESSQVSMPRTKYAQLINDLQVGISRLYACCLTPLACGLNLSARASADSRDPALIFTVRVTPFSYSKTMVYSCFDFLICMTRSFRVRTHKKRIRDGSSLEITSSWTDCRTYGSPSRTPPRYDADVSATDTARWLCRGRRSVHVGDGRK